MTSMDNRERNALARGTETEGDCRSKPRTGFVDLDARCARIKALTFLSWVLARESAEARVVAADLQRELDDLRTRLWQTGEAYEHTALHNARAHDGASPRI